MTGSAGGSMEIAFKLNGEPVSVKTEPTARLLDLLRYGLGLTGTKEGCGEGECCACTVYLDGDPVNACLVPVFQVRGREVLTIEGIDRGALGPLLQSGATQCGACTPGVVMTAMWVHERPQLLEQFSARELMAGNLCRCTGYDGIIDGLQAVLDADGAEDGG